jgi:hypothetical protein
MSLEVSDMSISFQTILLMISLSGTVSTGVPVQPGSPIGEGSVSLVQDADAKETDPAASDPAASDPAASDPAASDPAASDPAAYDPAEAEPPPAKTIKPKKIIKKKPVDQGAKTGKEDAYEPDGWGPWGTGALQVVLGLVGSYLPLLCPPLWTVSWFLGPALAALAQTIVGDMVGKKRGALMPTFCGVFCTQNGLLVLNVLLFYAGLGLGLVSAFVGYVLVLGLLISEGSPIGLIGIPFMACGGTCLVVSYLGIIVGIIGSFIGAQSMGSYMYNSWGDLKQPGDSGSFLFPGFLSPRHPEAKNSKVLRKKAMAY